MLLGGRRIQEGTPKKTKVAFIYGNTLSIYFHTFLHIKCIKKSPLPSLALISPLTHTLLAHSTISSLTHSQCGAAARVWVVVVLGWLRCKAFCRAAARGGRLESWQIGSQCISIYITLP